MEESKLTNEEDNSKESSPKNEKDIKNEQNVQAFSEPLKKGSDQDDLKQKANLNSEELKLLPIKSLFERFRNEGIDGITTNPNQKMLALLIILLINLSVFLAIGNIGKAYLRNAGIL